MSPRVFKEKYGFLVVLYVDFHSICVVERCVYQRDTQNIHNFLSTAMEAAPSNPPEMIFDIFLSFRGKDTRNTFVGHLYKALCQLGIMTFKDDKKLLMGDNLSDKLLKAIEESRASIVVLSKDYASSRWCLRELAKIIDCMSKSTTTRRVFPVFYHVEPCHVRSLSGSFKKSFKRYEKFAKKFTGDEKEKFSKDLQNWKDSMIKIGDVVGEKVTNDR